MLKIGIFIFFSIMFLYISFEYHRYNKMKALRIALHSKFKTEEKTPMKQIVSVLQKYVGKFFPNSLNERKIIQKLTWAGLNTSFEVFTAFRLILFMIPVLTYPLMLGIGNYYSYSIGIAVGAILFIVSEKYLDIKAKKRNEVIEKELFPLTELLLTSTQAGLDINTALMRVTRVQTGILSGIFKKAFQMIGSVMTKEEALEWVKSQAQVESLHLFIDAIIQAEKLGTSISETLVQQLDRIRNDIENKGVSKAQSLNTKMIIPIVVFIFFPLMVMFLAPTVLVIFQK